MLLNRQLQSKFQKREVIEQRRLKRISALIAWNFDELEFEFKNIQIIVIAADSVESDR